MSRARSKPARTPHRDVPGDPGVGHDEVEAPPRLDSARDRRPGVRRVAHVPREVTRLAAGVRDLADHLAERPLVPSRHQQTRPPGRQLQRDGPADPCAAAGDERHLPVEGAPPAFAPHPRLVAHIRGP